MLAWITLCPCSHVSLEHVLWLELDKSCQCLHWLVNIDDRKILFQELIMKTTVKQRDFSVLQSCFDSSLQLAKISAEKCSYFAKIILQGWFAWQLIVSLTQWHVVWVFDNISDFRIYLVAIQIWGGVRVGGESVEDSQHQHGQGAQLLICLQFWTSKKYSRHCLQSWWK